MRALRKGRERGATAVEMALVLPLLLLVLGGIIDFGRMFGVQVTITQASREGARMKSLGYSDADRDTRVKAVITNSTNPAATDPYPWSAINTSSCSATPLITDAAGVRVSAVFHFLVLDGVINLFGGGWASGITLTSTASMRCLG